MAISARARFWFAQALLLVVAVAIGWVSRGVWEALPREAGGADAGFAAEAAPTQQVAPAPDTQPLPPEVAELAEAIRGGFYARAVDLLETLEARSELAFHMGKLRFFAEADRLSPGDALELMQSYVQLYDRDVAALQRLAELYQRNGRMREALVPLYAVVRETGDAGERERARQRIKLLVDAIAQGLAQRGELDDLQHFGEKLTELDPYNDRYRYLAATWAVDAGDPDAARNLLALLPEYAVSETEYSRLQNRIAKLEAVASAQGDESTLHIPLQREGGRLLVRARIDQREDVRLLIDTGANISALKPEAVRGATRGPTIMVRTAGGVVRAPVVTLQSLELDRLHLESLPVAVMELGDLGEADGVLGMDVLGELNLRLDQDLGALVVQSP